MEEHMADQDRAYCGRNGAGAIPSRKLDRMVYYRSQVKRDCIRLLDHDPAVLTYREQPCTIRYVRDSLSYSYIPDFSVTWRQRPLGIIACTWETLVHDPDYLPRWTAAQLWCERHGYAFHLVTETSLLRYKILLSNLKMLTVHAYQALPPQAKEYILKIVMAEPNPLTIAQIVQRTPPLEARETRSYIWHLLATGEISADLTKPLNVETTRISWKGAQQHHGITSSL
jgi:hypothetical protein